MKKTENNLNVLDVVGIVLLTLKIIGVEPVAGWSWWIVLSPLWIYIGVLALLAVIASCVKSINKEKEN